MIRAVGTIALATQAAGFASVGLAGRNDGGAGNPINSGNAPTQSDTETAAGGSPCANYVDSDRPSVGGLTRPMGPDGCGGQSADCTAAAYYRESGKRALVRPCEVSQRNGRCIAGTQMSYLLTDSICVNQKGGLGSLFFLVESGAMPCCLNPPTPLRFFKLCLWWRNC